MPNLGALQMLHSFLRAQFTLPHLGEGGRGKEGERERERERERGEWGKTKMGVHQNGSISYMEHCQSSALNRPPLFVAADFPISEPVFLNTSTLPLSASQRCMGTMTS